MSRSWGLRAARGEHGEKAGNRAAILKAKARKIRNRVENERKCAEEAAKLGITPNQLKSIKFQERLRVIKNPPPWPSSYRYR